MSYEYDPVNKILIKTKDEQIKFINEGQKFRNKAGVEIKLTEVIPNRVQYSIYRNGKLSENSKTSDPETMIKILNRNGYVPVKDNKTVDASTGFVKIIEAREAMEKQVDVYKEVVKGKLRDSSSISQINKIKKDKLWVIDSIMKEIKEDVAHLEKIAKECKQDIEKL